MAKKTVMHNETPFPCTACGLCCRLVDRSPETNFLDRGDGTCRHLDTQTNLCNIYEERPLVCRVKDYHKQYLSTQFTWEDFVEKNISICKQLQEQDNQIKY